MISPCELLIQSLNQKFTRWLMVNLHIVIMLTSFWSRPSASSKLARTLPFCLLIARPTDCLPDHPPIRLPDRLTARLTARLPARQPASLPACPQARLPALVNTGFTV